MVVTAQLVKELRNRTGAGMLDCKKALEATDGKIEEAITWLREKGITKAAKKFDQVAAEGLVGLVTKKGDKTVIFEVNSETDFVAKNKQFLDLMATVGETLINNESKTVEDALKVLVNGEPLETVIVHAIATIGEKITLRRFKTIHLKADQSMGVYLHSNNRIATVLIFSGKIDETIGKQLAMHVSAMRPQFISRDDISADFLNNEKTILTAEAKNNPKNAGKPDNILEKMVEGRLNKQLAEISFLDQVFVVNPDQKISDVIKTINVNVVDMIRYEVGEGIEKKEVDFASEVMAQVRK
jgi:elongation factor Ts